MGKIIKKAGILCGVFIAALVIFFAFEKNTSEKSDTVYTSMEEATLPVVYTDMYNSEMNVLHGYLQEMDRVAGDDALTILPADRKLGLRIADYGESVLAVRYEIRSMDLQRLVERTEVENWEESSGSTNVVLPIQNLLTKDKQYLLHLFVETEQHGVINYYTRIMWTDNENIGQMVDFARDFSTRTFDYEQARPLTTYLESSSTEDDSSLGHVTIRSSYNQITWAGLDMQLEGSIQLTLKEVDGIMGNVQADYTASRVNEDGNKEYYEVSDNFTMKWSPQRIYLMDFERTTNQIFDGDKYLFSGKRILLGIGNEENITVRKSGNGNILAFRANRDLWSYNQEKKEAVRIFSFRSGNDDSPRSQYDQHDIRIISVSDNGDIDFLVYGYMNRGKHEGMMGISMYRYKYEGNTINESFFLPVTSSFDSLSSDIGQLACLGGTEMLYFYLNHAIYGIDLNSKEYIVVADSLDEHGFAVSQDGKRVAWQDGADLYQSELIHLMDLQTGQKVEITNSEGAVMRALGFVNNDFIYGLANKDDLWTVHGRVETLPMYALEIIDDKMEILTRYEKSGRYLSSVVVEDGRIHMDRLTKSGDGDYIKTDKDTIVCNEEVKDQSMDGIGWYASPERRQLYFVQLSSEIKNSRSVKVSTPKQISGENAEHLVIQQNNPSSKLRFYAYGAGQLLGVTDDFAEAVQLSYDKMGFVTDSNHQILWDRINRNPAKTIRDPKTAAYKLTSRLGEITSSQAFEDVLILDARGCSLNQILYFIDKGCPVAAYRDDGGYLLLYGYDQYNVSVYDPVTEETYKMGLGDGNTYFQSMNNDFICGLSVDKN
ncbi:MAG: hypothetical protein KH366_19240 [Clostridiaceae bacterium]|nr:hypothetical protein [Clostridiaceae bacterium]